METIVLKDCADNPLKLMELLEKLYGNKFEFHPEFFKEFVELIKSSGSEIKILKQFIQRLSSIILLGDMDYGIKWLEHLKKYGNMYSLHLDADSKNYRLLFSKNKNRKIFLRMFYERSGKSNTSYDINVKIALARRDYND